MNPLAALNRLGTLRSLIVIVTVLFAIAWSALTVTYGAIPVSDGLYSRLGGVAGADFQFFYSAAVMVHEGDADQVYDPSAVGARAGALLHRTTPRLVWAYPPAMSMVLWPVGALPPRIALLTWLGGLVAGLLALGRIATGAWRRAWIVFLFPGAGMVLLAGQFTAVLAPVLASALLLYASRPALAGGVFGLFILKPQFAFAVPLFAMLRRRWAFVAAAGAVATILCLLSLAWFGPHAWWAFAKLAVNRSASLKTEAPMFRFVSIFATLAMSGVSERLALVLHIASVIAIAPLAFDLAAHGRRESARALAFCAATILFSPYAYDYDLILLGLPWLLLVREASAEPELAVETLWRWLVLTWIVPVSYLTSLYTQRPVAGPLLWVFLTAVWAADYRQRKGVGQGQTVAPVTVI